MQRIFLVWFSLCCILFVARAEHEGVNLNPSDANIFGHVVDKKNRRAYLLYQYFPGGNDNRNGYRCYRTLHIDQLAGRRVSAGTEINRVSDGQEEGGPQERENLGSEF